MADYLFNDGFLADFLRQQEAELTQEITSLQRDYILNVSEDDICGHLTAKYILEIPILNLEEKAILETRPIQVRRPSMWGDGAMHHLQAQLIVLSVPFEGDPALLRYRPSTFGTKGVSARIADGELILQYEVLDNNKQQLQNELDGDINVLTKNLSNVQRDAAAYNSRVPAQVKRVVTERKQLLLQQADLVAGLNIPIRRRDVTAQTYAVPAVRRRPRIERPVVASGSFEPEPVLAMEEYEHVLIVAQSMSVMLEQSPATFAKLKEEEIRDHFLLQLNGQYQGQATGETFNQDGKTDIIIKINGKNVFIAECKFWKGPEGFPGCIDQLLGYTCWRDTKTAIFLFNKNKDTSKVLDQIPGLAKGHPNYKREKPGRMDETRFRYVFHQSSDVNREFYLTICVFDIPSPK